MLCRVVPCFVVLWCVEGDDHNEYAKVCFAEAWIKESLCLTVRDIAALSQRGDHTIAKLRELIAARRSRRGRDCRKVLEGATRARVSPHRV